MAESACSPSNLCYCTNVHAGTTGDEILENLDRYTGRVRELFCPSEPLGVGLWLPDGVDLRLDDERFAVRTINAFPFGNFHEDVVKHAVYEPSWCDIRRSNYSWACAAFLLGHLAEGASASVSTVPLGWALNEEDLALAGEMLRGLAVSLDETSERSRGRRATVDLEPEPGCALDTSGDVVRFFEQHLNNSYARKQIGVCHDVCHASVMFEGQRDAIKNYVENGIAVNKVQVSSAPRAVFTKNSVETLRAIASFEENRYLHQTSARTESGEVTFYEDLPLALKRVPEAHEEWRTHFHVPVYLESLGALSTTQNDILECMDACAEFGLDPTWEVETYAWNVLPEEFRVDDLAEGIAKELAWTRDRLDERGLLR